MNVPKKRRSISRKLKRTYHIFKKYKERIDKAYKICESCKRIVLNHHKCICIFRGAINVRD